MKKLLFFFVIVVLAFACSQIDEKLGDNKSNKLDTAKFALPLSVADIDISRYRTWTKSRNFKDTLPTFFTVRATDLIQVLGISKEEIKSDYYKHVRVYLGFDDNYEAHLLLTPVEGAQLECTKPRSAGKRIIRNGMMTQPACPLSTIKVAPVEGEYMLDFVNPCPPTCNTSEDK